MARLQWPWLCRSGHKAHAVQFLLISKLLSTHGKAVKALKSGKLARDHDEYGRKRVGRSVTHSRTQWQNTVHYCASMKEGPCWSECYVLGIASFILQKVKSEFDPRTLTQTTETTLQLLDWPLNAFARFLHLQNHNNVSLNYTRFLHYIWERRGKSLSTHKIQILNSKRSFTSEGFWCSAWEWERINKKMTSSKNCNFGSSRLIVDLVSRYALKAA